MKRFLLTGSLLAGLGLSNLTNAAVITDFTTPNSTQASFINGHLLLLLPQFDSSLGTLTGASLQIEGISQPQLEVLNVGNITGTGHGTTTAIYAVTGPGVSSLSASISSGPQSVTVAAGNLASSPPLSPIFFNPVVALSDLNALTGLGTVAFDIEESQTTSGTTDTIGADLLYGGSASANFLLDIAYTYTVGSIGGGDPIPEPFSLAVMGVGLLGIGVAKRRKQ
jgi:PEP-CTERM motif